MIRLKFASVAGLVLTASLVESSALLALDEVPAPKADEYLSPYDPLSSLNEKLLDLNLFLDDHLARPVATGWSHIMPYAVRSHIRSFFRNTAEPRNAINSLLQKRFHDAGIGIGRFAINSTLGLGGFFDVADKWFDLERHANDFGLTAAFYRVKFGPYLMAPAGGPTSTRDIIGAIADGSMNAVSTVVWLLPSLIYLPIAVGLGAIAAVNERSLNLDTFEDADRYAIDLYGAVQDAYYQRRIHGKSASGQTD